MQKYTITQIFMDALTKDELEEFKKVCPSPLDYDEISNLIALNEKAADILRLVSLSV